MTTVAREYLDSWHSGVVAAVEVSWPPGSTSQFGVDQLEASATPRAWNTALAIVNERAVPRKREGCATMNRSALSGSPAIIGQFAYRHRDVDTGEITQHHILVGDDGSFSRMDENGTVVVIDADAFTAGFHPPDFATLNNCCFVVNGEEATKLLGTTQYAFGITRPEIGTAAANAGTAGLPNGTYELRVTYINSTTGQESSASDTAEGTVTVLNQQILLTNLPVSDDPQVDEKGIYLREIATQQLFYRADTIDNADTTATINVDTTTLTTLAPDTNENDPPPDGVKFLAAHKNRLFAADSGKLYWSKIGKPESFDPDAFDLVNQDDGQKITGLASIPGGLLLIFKEDSYYVLEGDTPGTWAISKLGPSVGCIAHPSIEIGVDAVYWWAEQGPVRLPFGSLSTPELIGANRISAAIGRTAVGFDQRHRICTAFDITDQRVLFAVPDVGQLRNTRIMTWSSRLGCWESDRWDPIDAASLAVVNDHTSTPYVMIGSYNGQVFKLGVGMNDGVATGTLTGTFVAASTSHSTITDLTAEFDTTGAGLIERKVTILTSDAEVVTTGLRPRISSNTATVLTLQTPVGGLTSGATYTYIVGGPDWQFDTAWRDLGQPFEQKRLEFIYLLALLFGRSLYVDLVRNRKNDTLGLSRLATVTGNGSLWNTVNWNAFNWNDADASYERIRGGNKGITFSLRFRNAYANQPMLLLKTGFRAVLLDDKLGG